VPIGQKQQISIPVTFTSKRDALKMPLVQYMPLYHQLYSLPGHNSLRDTTISKLEQPEKNFCMEMNYRITD
jgi:hypothetical protein